MSDPREIEITKSVIGAFLRERRLAQGMTQLEVARHLDYSSSQFVSNWERGLALPPLEALPKISEFLKISPRELIEVVMSYQRMSVELERQKLLEAFKSKSRR